jgi:hypothetical protein
MKTFIVMCALAGMSAGCAAKDYPILHPSGKEWACGYHANLYRVRRDNKVVEVCCDEGYSPDYSRPGSCH